MRVKPLKLADHRFVVSSGGMDQEIPVRKLQIDAEMRRGYFDIATIMEGETEGEVALYNSGSFDIRVSPRDIADISMDISVNDVMIHNRRLITAGGYLVFRYYFKPSVH